MGLGRSILFGGLGFVLGGPLGAVIGGVIGLLSGNTTPQAPQCTSSRQRATQGDLQVSLLVLIAAVMKADGHVRKAELDVVKKFLREHYTEAEAIQALQLLKGILEKDFDYQVVAQQMTQYINYSLRHTMLHFLLELAHADGEYADAERRVIENIAAIFGISQADYKSLLSLYQKQDPNWAYAALEITPEATNEEVKKAYRRMAMKYHPDKVAGAGEEIQKKATEKFRAINEAYETIKTARGL